MPFGVSNAQQAVEKLLKAILVLGGIEYPFTHRLYQLADLLADSARPVDARFEPLLDLTPYAVELRYATPDNGTGDPRIDRAKMLELIIDLRDTLQCSLLEAGE